MTRRTVRVARGDEAHLGPVPTIAIQSTRSASATNVFTGSPFTTHSPVAPATATVPVTDPPARRRASVPDRASSGANCATVGKNTPGAAT